VKISNVCKELFRLGFSQFFHFDAELANVSQMQEVETCEQREGRRERDGAIERESSQLTVGAERAFL